MQDYYELLPLFVPCPNAQTKTGSANQDKYTIRPGSLSPLYLKMYYFLGQLMGVSIRTGVLLTLDLPLFFWKALAGEKPTFADLKAIDFEFCKMVELMANASEVDFDEQSGGATFTLSMSDKSVR